MTKAELHQCLDFIDSNMNKIIDSKNLDDINFLSTVVIKFIEEILNSKLDELGGKNE